MLLSSDISVPFCIFELLEIFSIGISYLSNTDKTNNAQEHYTVFSHQVDHNEAKILPVHPGSAHQQVHKPTATPAHKPGGHPVHKPVHKPGSAPVSKPPKPAKPSKPAKPAKPTKPSHFDKHPDYDSHIFGKNIVYIPDYFIF